MVPTSAMHTCTSFRFVSVHIFYFWAKTFLVEGAIITAHFDCIVQFYVKYSSLDVLVYLALTLINSKCVYC